MSGLRRYSLQSAMTVLIGPSKPIVIPPSAEMLVVRPKAVVRIEPTGVTRIIPRSVATLKVEPARPATIRPPRRGAWDERGWTRRNDGTRQTYEGHYQTGERRFRGRIEVERRDRISAFIHNPPAEIRRHRHHACFQQIGIGTGWFRLHWRRSPRNVDEAILYFEQVLDESLNR